MEKKEISASRLIGTAGILLIIVLALCSTGIRTFIYFPALIYVLAITFFLLLGSFGKDFLMFIPDSFCSLFFRTSPNQKYAEIAKFGNRYAITAGAIGTTLTIIVMLQNINDPSIIGLTISRSLCFFFYAMIIAEFYFGYVYKAYLGDEEYKGKKPLSVKSAVIPCIFILFMLSIYFISLATVSTPPVEFFMPSFTIDK